MAEGQQPTSVGAQVGGLAGAAIGGLAGGAGGAMIGQKVGSVAGTLAEPYLSPEQTAQRREFQKARDRLRSGVGYGMSRAQKQQERAESGRQQAAQLAAQQAVVQQQMAAGMLSGGAANEARRIMSGQQAAATAQSERDIQSRSTQLAQQQYLMDQARIDAEAARAIARSQQQGAEIEQAGLTPDMFGKLQVGKGGKAVDKVANVPPEAVGGAIPGMG